MKRSHYWFDKVIRVSSFPSWSCSICGHKWAHDRRHNCVDPRPIGWDAFNDLISNG